MEGCSPPSPPPPPAPYTDGDYPKERKFFDPTNKKVIRKFKDEAAGMPIVEFIGLKSKMYSFVKDNGKRGQERCHQKEYHT